MAEHVWSVLCDKMLKEEGSNLISLISVIKKIYIPMKPEEVDQELKGSTGFAHPMRLIIWCVRSDRAKPESFDLRVGWQCPNGEYLPLGENRAAIDGSNTGARVQQIVPGVPWRGLGLYWLIVEKRDEGQDEWTTAARIPLELATVQ